MKKIQLILLILISFNTTLNAKNSENEIELIIDNLIIELNQSRNYYSALNDSISVSIMNLEVMLNNETNIDSLVQFLIVKGNLESVRRKNNILAESDISKIKYLKGLDILKVLYEKTLSLDHHFTSVSSYNEISNLSNPNNYSEFKNIKGLINERNNKKHGFQLTGILGENIYTSVIHSFVSLFNSNKTSKTIKEDRLKEVECILDFTLQMHNDLNIIYFETAFLEKNNQRIMKDLEDLFIDFVTPIGYSSSLKECRDNDNWDKIKEGLSFYMEEMNQAVVNKKEFNRAETMNINLKFPIDQLLQFITIYNNFINQGQNYYEKFAVMLNSYRNEEHCSEKIPQEYKKLKEGISNSIEKFNTAYKPVEINGSKLKALLYGINEYD